MSLIIQFTTVHPRHDTRVRLKETAALAQMVGVSVHLYVQDGLGNEIDPKGFLIIDTGPAVTRRFARMTLGAWRMYRAVRRARPAVAHFHDPELIPIGLMLKLSGIKVVYDVHEDVPRQIAGKHWVPRPLKGPLVAVAAAFEWAAGRAFDGIVPATPSIAEHFPSSNCTLVQNFPLSDELVEAEPTPYAARPPHVAYVGGISKPRGLIQMIQALPQVGHDGVRLIMAGAFQLAPNRAEAEALPGWVSVDFVGWADRTSVARLLGQVRAGLVLFHPAPNHTSSQPNKLFEYMAAGLPLIASDFPLWRQIVEGVDCGVLVDPLDPAAIAGAIQWILDNPADAEAMGQRGRLAVQEHYNWPVEGAKLVGLYERLLGEASLPKAA